MRERGYSGTMSNSRLPYNAKSPEEQYYNHSRKDPSNITQFDMISTTPDDYNYNNYNDAYLPEENPKKSWFQDFKDGFKRAPMPYIDPGLSDEEKMNLYLERSPLKRRLFSRHLQMIAIGGSIGAGLFIGSGTCLATGGPASVLLCWAVAGTMLYCTVQGLGELAVAFPVSGSFIQYNTRFISPSWSFAMAWNYVISWIVIIPLELTAASIVIDYWNDEINSSVWVTIFLFVLVVINFFGVRGYGEAEYLMCSIKVLAIIGFIILGIVLNCGGGPVKGYIGGKFWHHPGAFTNGFKGFCSIFPTSVFSFSGTEVIGLTAAETENPRETLPKATKQVFWRITFFYMVSLTLVGLLVPYTDTRLTDGTSSYDIHASPFVIAIKRGGIESLPSVFNAIVLIAVFSVGNTSVFAGSRSMVSLAEQGFGPQCLGYVDRKGRPLTGIVICLAFGLLGYLASTADALTIFDWLISLSGLATIFTWWSICICHIRFRAVLKLRDRGTDELTFVAQTGVAGSYIGAALMVAVLASQFWVALFPIGSPPDASLFFQVWLCVPINLVCWIGYMIWKRDWRLYIKSEDIDVDSGRGVLDLQLLREEIAEEKDYIAAQPLYYRAYKYWC